MRDELMALADDLNRAAELRPPLSPVGLTERRIAKRIRALATQQPEAGYVATYMGKRYKPDGTKEFWGWLAEGVDDLPPTTRLYAATKAEAQEAAHRFLMSNDLYSMLTDIQNGIDSPGTCGLANSLIIRLDKVRAAMVALIEAGNELACTESLRRDKPGVALRMWYAALAQGSFPDG